MRKKKNGTCVDCGTAIWGIKRCVSCDLRERARRKAAYVDSDERREIQREIYRRKARARGSVAAERYLHLPHSASVEDKFLVKAKADDHGCWQWLGARNTGYGLFMPGNVHNRAHRWAYQNWRGPIPEDLTVDHLCRDRGCVNPWHLELVTSQENIRRYREEIPPSFPQAPLDAVLLMERADDLRLEAYRRKAQRARG